MNPFRSNRGQSTVEYIAVVALVAAIMVGVLAVTPPGRAIASLVSDKIEYAICVVGLDVCSAEDARAEGLAPCVTDSENRQRGTTFTIAVYKTGGKDSLLVERRSDGTYRLTASHDTDLAVTGGLGLKGKLGSAGFDAGIKAEAGSAFGSGTAIEVENEAALQRLLGDARKDPSKAKGLVKALAKRRGKGVTTYKQLEPRAGAKASASISMADETLGVEQSAELREAIGESTRDGIRTSYYSIPASTKGPLSKLLPVDSGRVGASYQRSKPPVLTIESATGKGARENVVEAKLVLATREDREMASKWLTNPVAALRDPAGRALASRLSRKGVVQRFTYDNSTADEGSWGAGVQLGGGLGIDNAALVKRRNLVDARVLDRPIGGQRRDCLDRQAR